MKFTKMHGAGNDYIYINGIATPVENPTELAIAMSDRHFGVGSDGLVLVLSSEIADFCMRMFNADGSEAEMCGNASRCVGKFLYEKGLTSQTEIRLETLAGIKVLHLEVVDGLVQYVTVDMGEPILEPARIPIQATETPTVALPIEVDGAIFHLTAVSMGNPHAVIFKEKVEERDIYHYGKLIEHHSLFPQRTNVEFCQVLSPTELRMRVWERGSGETLACGTGACATLVAAVLNGLSQRKATLHLLGGDLEIEWRESNNRVYMRGGAEIVFEGEYVK